MKKLLITLLLLCITIFSFGCASEKDILVQKQIDAQAEFIDLCDMFRGGLIVNNPNLTDLQKDALLALFERCKPAKETQTQENEE